MKNPSVVPVVEQINQHIGMQEEQKEKHKNCNVFMMEVVSHLEKVLFAPSEERI